MTREEIRVITLAKARLGPEMVVWDVGSGTGSISVEAALRVPGGRVYAVERSADGIELTGRNAEKFGIDNITVVPGEAPETLRGLPAPHRVIVGGSGGKLGDILNLVGERMASGGRLVINAVTLETLSEAITCLTPPWRTEVVQIFIARGEMIGKSHIMRGSNPVYIITAWKEDDRDDR